MAEKLVKSKIVLLTVGIFWLLHFYVIQLFLIGEYFIILFPQYMAGNKLNFE